MEAANGDRMGLAADECMPLTSELETDPLKWLPFSLSLFLALASGNWWQLMAIAINKW